ncbi:MAG: restriction endonuclease subunit S [Fibrobacterota bacterium]|nr:MAG: restriction endonuclease subunit S [Fibrobacterota bacterium]
MSDSASHQLAEYETAGEIELGRGEVISSIDLNTHIGDYPVYSSSAVGNGEFGRYGRYMFDEELITWSIDGGGRPFYRPKHKYSVTNVCGFLRIKRPDLWSYRYLHALLEKLQSGIQFDYQMKAHPSVIRELYRFPRIPMSHQLQIGNILDTLDTAIQQTEAILEKLKAVKQGLLHDLLTRGIDANGQLRPPQAEAPHLYKESPLGWIPREWEPAVLNDFVNAKRPIVYGILMPGYGFPGGVPVVKVKDIFGGRIRSEDLLLTSPVIDREYSRSRLRSGDFLFTIRGSVGRTAFVPSHLNDANITQDTARISVVDYDARFIRDFLAMPIASTFISIHTLGVAVQGINLRDMRKIPILKPSKDEATEIANRLETFDVRIEREAFMIKKMMDQKKALMDDLLTGRVRVTPLLEKAA